MIMVSLWLLMVVVWGVRGDCLLATECPDVSTCKPGDTVRSVPGITYTCSLELRNFTKVTLSEGKYYNLSILADEVEIAGIIVEHTLIILANTDLRIKSDSRVRARRIIIANNRNAKISPTKVEFEAEMVLLFSTENITLTDTTITSTKYQCTEEVELVSYPTEFLKFNYSTTFNASVSIREGNETLTNLLVRLSQRYSAGLYSYKSVNMVSSKIVSSFVSVASGGLVVDQNSEISSFGMGCKDRRGLGRGIKYSDASDNCNSSGASAAGHGSSDCQYSIQYFSFILHSYPYGNKINPLVTGSAGYSDSPVDLDRGAGGIIMLRSAGNFVLNGIINSSSQSPIDSSESSAGSGGTINVVTQQLSGSGEMVAEGGSDFGLAGHGSGGWIKLIVVGENLFEGSIKADSGGKEPALPSQILADNGNLLIPSCVPGQFHNKSFSLKCQECDSSSYKSPLAPSCLKCPNPKNQLSDSLGKRKASECVIVHPKRRWQEQSPRDFLVHYSIFRIAVLFSSLLVFVGIGFLLFKKFKKKKNILESEGFDFNKVINDLNQDSIITQSLRAQKQFKMGDLLYHVHRITVFGTNSSHSPWKIASKIPEQLKFLLIPDTFQDFTRIFNRKARWTLLETSLIYLSTLFYPLYWFLLIKIKKSKYKKVAKLMDNTMLNFVQPSYLGRQVLKAKLSKSTDYTVCYIDVFNYYEADLKYFKLEYPYLVHMSGEGNFVRPFYLCEADPFLNSLFMVINRNIKTRFIDDRFKIIDNLVSHAQRIENATKLTQFVRYFNRTSRTLDLAASTEVFVREVMRLISYIKRWNTEFFVTKNVRISLVMMVTYFRRDRVLDNQISILENESEREFSSFMEGTLKTLRQSSSNDLKFALFVYNPEKDLNSLVEENDIHSYPSILDHEPTLNQLELLPRKKPKAELSKKIINVCSRVRYLLISHKYPSLQKYTLRMLLALLVLLHASIISIWEEEWIGVPYLFINLIVPFVGIIWLASGISYGVGKMFLVLNSLSIVDNLVFLVSSVLRWNETSGFYKTVRLMLVAIQLADSWLGCQIVTSSKKLNQPKIS